MIISHSNHAKTLSVPRGHVLLTYCLLCTLFPLPEMSLPFLPVPGLTPTDSARFNSETSSLTPVTPDMLDYEHLLAWPSWKHVSLCPTTHCLVDYMLGQGRHLSCSRLHPTAKNRDGQSGRLLHVCWRNKEEGVMSRLAQGQGAVWGLPSWGGTQ